MNIIKYTVLYFVARISTDGVIKVADFGLSEDVYMKNYFRLKANTDSQKTQIKLPIKWMAIESIHDGLFSEMTDVVYDIKKFSHVRIGYDLLFYNNSGLMESYAGKFSLWEKDPTLA